APEGTAARPIEPSSSTTSTSTVGLPRLSRISRPMMSTMAVMGASLENAGIERSALLLQQGLGAEKARHRVTLMSQLAYNAATETGMSKKPRKSSQSASESSGLQLGRAVEWPKTPDAAN